MSYSPIQITLLALLVAFALRLLLGAIRRSRGTMNIEDINKFKPQKALILDVRTRAEYSGGHVAGSLNIPLNELPGRIKELDRSRPILACCASGARSASAKELLDRAGFPHVYNVGPWRNAE